MDRKMISSSEGSASGGDLMNLMRELISLREKVAQAELRARARRALTASRDRTRRISRNPRNRLN